MHTEIIGIACLAIIIVNFGKPADLLKRYLYGSDYSKWKRMKPLDCAFCLSWWLGLSFFLYTYGWVGILYASIATVIVALLETKLWATLNSYYHSNRCTTTGRKHKYLHHHQNKGQSWTMSTEKSSEGTCQIAVLVWPKHCTHFWYGQTNNKKPSPKHNLPMMSRNQRGEERMSNEETHNDIPKPFRIWH